MTIDSTTGLVSLTSSYGTEPAFAYHDSGYLTLAPNDTLNYSVFLSHTAGSRNAQMMMDITEDLTGAYLWIDNAWNKILTQDSNGNITLATATKNDGSEDVHVGILNEIAITGTSISLSKLDYSYEPRTL